MSSQRSKRFRACRRFCLGSTLLLVVLLCSVLVGCGSDQQQATERASTDRETLVRFNSQLPLRVYAVSSWTEGPELLGETPCPSGVEVPECLFWWVEPIGPVDWLRLRAEIMARAIPGIAVWRATDADLKHLEGLTGLQALYLAGTEVTDAGLEHLEGLTGLRWLHLSCAKVTEAGLKHLEGLTGLQVLDLSGTRVTDAGPEHLEGLTALQELYLTGTRVTDAGLEHLEGLTALQELNLSKTQVTDAGIQRLRNALPRVRISGP